MRRSNQPAGAGAKGFIRAMSVQIPILQQPAAKLTGPMIPRSLLIQNALFPIARLPPQRLYLGAELVDDLLEILDMDATDLYSIYEFGRVTLSPT